jgi:UDPglucose 6-dehydrogenase/GDP-mannose 6-dehydrogenase
MLEDGRRIAAPINSFLWAGCGFGGSCLPKDAKALQAHGEAAMQPMPLLHAVLRINQEQPRRMIALLKKRLPALRDTKVTVLGLSFRQDTDDMRESPAIPIVQELLSEGAAVTAYDPRAECKARKVFGDVPIRYAPSLLEAVVGAEAIVLVTSWDEFLSLPDLLRDIDSRAVVIDGRRVLDKSRIDAYEGIGC